MEYKFLKVLSSMKQLGFKLLNTYQWGDYLAFRYKKKSIKLVLFVNFDYKEGIKYFTKTENGSIITTEKEINQLDDLKNNIKETLQNEIVDKINEMRSKSNQLKNFLDELEINVKENDKNF